MDNQTCTLCGIHNNNSHGIFDHEIIFMHQTKQHTTCTFVFIEQYHTITIIVILYVQTFGNAPAILIQM